MRWLCRVFGHRRWTYYSTTFSTTKFRACPRCMALQQYIQPFNDGWHWVYLNQYTRRGAASFEAEGRAQGGK